MKGKWFVRRWMRIYFERENETSKIPDQVYAAVWQDPDGWRWDVRCIFDGREERKLSPKYGLAKTEGQAKRAATIFVKKHKLCERK